MAFSSRKLLVKDLAVALVKLTIAGVAIGLFKSYDGILAGLLLLKIAHVFSKALIQSSNKNWVMVLGMLMTGIIGYVAEHFGVKYGKWVYHDVASDLPLWLPFAWMLAFYFLYGIEKRLVQNLQQKTTANKVVIALLLSLIVPAFGEMITIAMGVWTYDMSYKLLGVPALAFVALVGIHMIIYWLLYRYCKRFGVADPVFS